MRRTAAANRGVLTRAQKWFTGIMTMMAAVMALLVNAKTLGLSPWLGLLVPNVADQSAHRIILFPRSDTLRAIGEPAVITATVTDARGAAVAGASLRWKSSDTSVALVDSTGAIVARAPGRATVEVSVREIVATAAVLVRPVAAHVQIAGDSALTLADGDSVQLVAHPLDARGHPVTGLPIEWRSTDPRVVQVDSTGAVRALAPGRAAVTATLGELTDTVRTNVVLVPTEIVVVSGAGQRALAGRSLAAPVVLEVRTRTGRPVPGANLVVTTADGEGTVSPDTARTDAAGRARVSWRLGATAGEHRLIAHESSLDTVTVVSAEADPSPGNVRVEVLTTEIISPVLRELGQPVRVRVTDSLGAVLSSVRVSWSAYDGGSVSGAERTDTSGFAEARWTLGPRSGAQRLMLQVGNARYTPATTIRVTAAAGAPVKLVVQSGDQQRAVVGTLLAAPIVLRVRDSVGNPVIGAMVIGKPSAGSLADTTVTTGADGTATVRWTLGARPGVQRLEMHLVGADARAPVTATSRVGPPANISIVTRDTGARGALRVVANVVDAQGNPLAGAPLTFSTTSGTLSAAQAKSDATGRAQVSWVPPVGATREVRISARVTGTKVTATQVVPARVVPATRKLTPRAE